LSSQRVWRTGCTARTGNDPSQAASADVAVDDDVLQGQLLQAASGGQGQPVAQDAAGGDEGVGLRAAVVLFIRSVVVVCGEDLGVG
jgi:hypothetical protein